MHAGGASRVNNILGFGIPQSGDVFAHGALKQLHVLRQIADVAAEVLGISRFTLQRKLDKYGIGKNGDGAGKRADLAVEGKPSG